MPRMDITAFIEKLGGPRIVADELGHPLTTVRSWVDRGKVPRWHVPPLVAMAVKNGVRLPAGLVGKGRARG